MLGRIIGGLVFSAALGSFVAIAQQAGDPARGHAFAARQCVECHAVEASPAPSPNTAAPSFFSVANTPGMTEMALGAFLFTPHNKMPNFIIAPADARDLIAYVLSLKRQPPL